MTTTESKLLGSKPWTRARERCLLLTLAAIQFTTIVDFLIIIPLGPQYEEVFHINYHQFGLILSSYGFSAALSGLVAGFFLDRFGRKTALLFLFAGFTLGTFLCAVSPTYELLVASRFATGAFGGVVGGVVLSIVGDVVPMERRGAAMGLVMSAFSVASIAGVPLGLELATDYNWHVPFLALVVLSAAILVVVACITPPLRDHLRHAADEHPVARTWAVMTHPDHQKAYTLMAVLTCAGFFVFPFIADFMVDNVGLTRQQLRWIYLCGGLCTLFSMNWVGRWSDRSGKLRVFTLTSLSTAVPLLLVTNLPRVHVAAAIAASTLLFICMSGRMVPAMAMMTAAVEARDRGGFMSINSSVQQLTVSLTAWLGGLILAKTPDGHMTHFPINGLISITCAYTCIYLARFLKPAPERQSSAEPVIVESV
jgi:predicted MFS family arabinose efflux permease